MSTLITRIYEAYGDALNAVSELKRNRFGENAIHLISMAPNDPAQADMSLEDRIAEAGIPAADAKARPPAWSIRTPCRMTSPASCAWRFR